MVIQVNLFLLDELYNILGFSLMLRRCGVAGFTVQLFAIVVVVVVIAAAKGPTVWLSFRGSV